jgi:hypothetical protein
MAGRSSPSRTAGICIRKATLGGVEYVLSVPDKVRRAADEEAVVISRRLDMLPALAKACADIPAEERQAWRQDYIRTMIVGIASPEEWTTYYRSPWNTAFRFWNALDPKEKGDRSLLDGVGWCYELLNADDVTDQERDSLWLAIRMVSQEGALGESSGCQQPKIGRAHV